MQGSRCFDVDGCRYGDPAGSRCDAAAAAVGPDLSQIEHWQSQYPPAIANDVRKLVMDAYEEVAVAKVSHLHALTGNVFSEESRDVMLENPALSASLLGLISEDALIGPRTGSLGTKRRKGEASGDPDEVAPAA